MDKQRLSEGIQSLIDSGNRTPEETVFLRLLKQVWQIDWTIPPYDVWTHMIEWDVPYFRRFMILDEGDEAEEEQIIRDWTEVRMGLGGKEKSSARETKRRIIDLIQELNVMRSRV
ncbi:hypothetical protein GSN00_07785 [Cylindrospermopsis raciborskii CHAB3438]|uniref:hypothetical protein n=1 Tax=Cylindrospermopsis raciborskii TaxID=77022 RepID=UPI001F11803B|nr:hypothetical protein [Cylindrospermopsis raciborskii]MCH4904288.1 hypothetical protein [Cylindrospermopsis raciborskii CHAB3438]